MSRNETYTVRNLYILDLLHFHYCTMWIDNFGESNQIYWVTWIHISIMTAVTSISFWCASDNQQSNLMSPTLRLGHCNNMAAAFDASAKFATI